MASDLGHLPLALAQAAAYIADKPLLTVPAYRQRLADRRRKLSNWPSTRGSDTFRARATTPTKSNVTVGGMDRLPSQPFGR
nr:hypothetical protein GCM10020241_00970 [Streptoalloteichus tenebrarius]